MKAMKAPAFNWRALPSLPLPPTLQSDSSSQSLPHPLFLLLNLLPLSYSLTHSRSLNLSVSLALAHQLTPSLCTCQQNITVCKHTYGKKMTERQRFCLGGLRNGSRLNSRSANMAEHLQQVCCIAGAKGPKLLLSVNLPTIPMIF